MRFPVFVLMKDCGEISQFRSVEAMQQHLEAIDIDNKEYLAWDAKGTSLELGTQKPVWIKIEEKGNDQEALIRALRAFAASKGVEVKGNPSSLADIEALYQAIAGKRR